MEIICIFSKPYMLVWGSVVSMFMFLEKFYHIFRVKIGDDVTPYTAPFLPVVEMKKKLCVCITVSRNIPKSILELL